MTAHVMISAAGALSAPEVVWSLQDAGFEVFACALRGSRPALRYSKSVELVDIASPRDDAERSVEELIAALSTRACDIFLPLDDPSLWLAAQLLERAPEIRIPIDRDGFELTTNKQQQIELAGRSGLQVPETIVARSAPEALATRAFPAFVKGGLAIVEREGRLVRDACFAVENANELEHVVANWDFPNPMLIQPRLSGRGVGVFGLATERGVAAWSAHQRVRMLNPQGSGSSACESIEMPSALRSPIAKMIEASRWRGMFMLEFLRDSDGTDWFMELNGRAWGSMALARRQGFEYPAWTVEALLDAGFAPPDVAMRPMCARNLGREVLHWLAVLRGPKSAAVANWPSRWKTTRDLLSFERSDRWYNWNAREPRVFWQDAWDTMRGALNRKRA